MGRRLVSAGCQFGCHTLWRAAWERTAGKSAGTPVLILNDKHLLTLNEEVANRDDLLQAVVASVGTMLQRAGKTASLSIAPQLHTLPARPARPAGFVGRERDLAILRALPAGGTVITGLRGMGGIGKTALATVLAHEWTPRFPNAQLMLHGQGTSERPPSGTDLQRQVILAFHPDAEKSLPDSAAGIAALFAQVLQGQRVLLFLDNAKDAAQAKALLPPAGCGLIVTSRSQFMIGTQRPYDVGRLEEGEALSLLREFHPALSDADGRTLARLCGGLPLALRIAGAHLALDGGQPRIAQYIQQLQSGALATLDPDAADAGEVTISETLRLSEAMLSEADRQAWHALSVFDGSFDERAAQAIVEAFVSRIDSPGSDAGASRGGDAPTTLLVRRSLLERVEGDRYQFHDLARDYARARLGPAALDHLRLAHARHYTAIGEEAVQLYLKGQPVPGLALFDAERAQLEAAYAWLVKVVPSFSSSDLGKDEDSRDSEAVRAKAQDYSRQLIALVDAIAYTSNLRFHARQRIAWYESQAQAARLVADRAAEGNALGNLGLAHADLGDAHKAIEFYEQRLVIAREIGDRRGEGNALGNLGNAHAALGDACRAIEYHTEALVVMREIGDRRAEGTIVGNLGLAHAALGDARKAIEFYEQQLVIVREIGDRRGEGNALWNSALALDSLGQRAEALTRARATLAIFEAIENPNAARVRARIAQWEAAG